MLPEIQMVGVMLKPQTLDHVVRAQELFEVLGSDQHELAALECLNPGKDYEEFEMAQAFVSTYYRAIEGIIAQYEIRITDDPEQMEFGPRLDILEALINSESRDNFDVIDNLLESEWDDNGDLLAALVDRLTEANEVIIRDYIVSVPEEFVIQLRRLTANEERETESLEQTREILSAYNVFKGDEPKTGTVFEYARLYSELPLDWNVAVGALGDDLEALASDSELAHEFWSLGILCGLTGTEARSRILEHREAYLELRSGIDRFINEYGDDNA